MLWFKIMADFNDFNLSASRVKNDEPQRLERRIYQLGEYHGML
jgi:hypothetical protein